MRVFIIGLLSIMTLPAVAQLPEHQDRVERVEVIGQHPLSHFRSLYRDAEDDFYAMYNGLTENDDFKIECEQTKLHDFTNLRKRVCQPNFVQRIRYELTQEAFDSVSPRKRHTEETTFRVGFSQEERKRVEAMREQQLQDLAEQIQNSPELLQRYARLVQAKDNYESRKDAED